MNLMICDYLALFLCQSRSCIGTISMESKSRKCLILVYSVTVMLLGGGLVQFGPFFIKVGPFSIFKGPTEAQFTHILTHFLMKIEPFCVQNLKICPQLHQMAPLWYEKGPFGPLLKFRKNNTAVSVIHL